MRIIFYFRAACRVLVSPQTFAVGFLCESLALDRPVVTYIEGSLLSRNTRCIVLATSVVAERQNVRRQCSTTSVLTLGDVGDGQGRPDNICENCKEYSVDCVYTEVRSDYQMLFQSYSYGVLRRGRDSGQRNLLYPPKNVFIGRRRYARELEERLENAEKLFRLVRL